MTDATYFTAPDGHEEETLWALDPTGDPRFHMPIIRRCDLGGMAHHWDELVARVIAGNPDAATIECGHPKITADRKPDGSADVRCVVCGFSGRIMSDADYAAQIAARRPY